MALLSLKVFIFTSYNIDVFRTIAWFTQTVRSSQKQPHKSCSTNDQQKKEYSCNFCSQLQSLEPIFVSRKIIESYQIGLKSFAIYMKYMSHNTTALAHVHQLD